MNKMSFRWYGDGDLITLAQIKQIPGVTEIVSELPNIPNGEVWPGEQIAGLKAKINQSGFEFHVVESLHVHDAIKLGTADRDHYIENYRQSLVNLAANGITTVCFSFMPVFNWTRTDFSYRLPDGSTSLAFKQQELEGGIDSFLANFKRQNGGVELPGWSSRRIAELPDIYRQFQGITEEQLRSNLAYFVKQILPTCERVGITLAIHPDDPPMPLFGLPRIYKNASDIRQIMNLADSKQLGITLCVGSLGENPKNDVPGIIREFVPSGRVPFVHVRNLKWDGDGDFHETAHLSSEGSLDMYEIMKALHDSKFTGNIRPDHGRMIWGEQGRPGYGLYDRAMGINYLNGLWEAIDKTNK
ncbi:mannonate dehydratase [Lentilactobacillus sp. Marseille-Q4993]|uniref:mannonate dehydratase n=1 Tax=Lentilactobacillus sp. Marseille-Q4993 TaxID=3039492 RepID=UPI0024BD120F|nr:mannonate dehydratase [Lentilactobacillus sp. Marseille-Q4993]